MLISEDKYPLYKYIPRFKHFKQNINKKKKKIIVRYLQTACICAIMYND